MRVLVGESDRDTQTAIADTLESEGHVVSFAGSADELLAALSAGVDADVVLLSTRLPPDDLVRVSKLPIVVATSKRFHERRGRAWSQVLVLDKPFGMKELLAALDDGVARGRETAGATRPPRGLVSRTAAAALCAFFALSIERTEHVRQLLDGEWEAGPADGVAVLRVEAHPTTSATEAFLVWIADGATYPLHGHEGEEHKLLLYGGLRDDNGDECWAGETVVHYPGSWHASTAIGGRGCLLAAYIHPIQQEGSTT